MQKIGLDCLLNRKKTLVDYRLIFIGIEIDFFPFFYLRLNQFGGDRFGGFFLLLTAEKGKINWIYPKIEFIQLGGVLTSSSGHIFNQSLRGYRGVAKPTPWRVSTVQ